MTERENNKRLLADAYRILKKRPANGYTTAELAELGVPYKRLARLRKLGLAFSERRTAGDKRAMVWRVRAWK